MERKGGREGGRGGARGNCRPCPATESGCHRKCRFSHAMHGRTLQASSEAGDKCNKNPKATRLIVVVATGWGAAEGKGIGSWRAVVQWAGVLALFD